MYFSCDHTTKKHKVTMDWRQVKIHTGCDSAIPPDALWPGESSGNDYLSSPPGTCLQRWVAGCTQPVSARLCFTATKPWWGLNKTNFEQNQAHPYYYKLWARVYCATNSWYINMRYVLIDEMSFSHLSFPHFKIHIFRDWCNNPLQRRAIYSYKVVIIMEIVLFIFQKNRCVL